MRERVRPWVRARADARVTRRHTTRRVRVCVRVRPWAYADRRNASKERVWNG